MIYSSDQSPYLLTISSAFFTSSVSMLESFIGIPSWRASFFIGSTVVGTQWGHHSAYTTCIAFSFVMIYRLARVIDKLLSNFLFNFHLPQETFEFIIINPLNLKVICYLAIIHPYSPGFIHSYFVCFNFCRPLEVRIFPVVEL